LYNSKTKGETMKNINQLKTVLIMLLLVLGITLNAQDKVIKDKIADLKGKIEKVTFKVDGKDVVFEGKEADRIAKFARAAVQSNAFVFSTDDEDGMPGVKKRIKVIKSGGNAEFDVMTSDDFDWKTDKDQKKVKVEIKDGKKNITVTTNKDGKEETKTYEGEEAEKFLKEQEGEGNIKVYMKKLDDDDSDDECEDEDHLIMFNKKMGGGCSCCCSNSCGSGMRHMKIMKGGKGNMMWKMMDDDDNEKKVQVIVEKKSDKKKELKETKETKKEEKK
jgi:hypothetical protein